MSESFLWERRVEFCETDAAGIVHFSSLLIYMEQAEHALLRSLGLSVAKSKTSSYTNSLDDQISWPRVQVACEFLAPAKFEDLLTIAIHVAALGSKSLTYASKISIGERLIARGSITCVCCRQSDNGLKSIEIPVPIRDSLERFRIDR